MLDTTPITAGMTRMIAMRRIRRCSRARLVPKPDSYTGEKADPYSITSSVQATSAPGIWMSRALASFEAANS
jgi:hypothetical protein